MKVLKFGGTSVGKHEGLKNIKHIILAEQKAGNKLVVVVSAMHGVTNELLRIASLARQGKAEECRESLSALQQRHQDAVKRLVDAQYHQRLDEWLDQVFQKDAIIATTRLAEAKDNAEAQRLTDMLLTCGELASSALVACMVHADLALATQFVKTLNGKLEVELSKKLIRNDIASRSASVILTQGFIASDVMNHSYTNLGRGGSDLTAALIAVALNASCLEIWTDVDGFMTADPRLHPDATLIHNMTFEQAQTMCDAGAKVIYAPTIGIAAAHGIVTWVKNTFNPSCRGTMIAAAQPSEPQRS